MGLGKIVTSGTKNVKLKIRNKVEKHILPKYSAAGRSLVEAIIDKNEDGTVIDKKVVKKLVELEKWYTLLGYKPLSLEQFKQNFYQEKTIWELSEKYTGGQKIMHASEFYKDNFKGKINYGKGSTQD